MSECAIQRRYHNKYKYFQNLLISPVESDLYNGLCYPGDKSLLSYLVDSYLSNGWRFSVDIMLLSRKITIFFEQIPSKPVKLSTGC